jgi:hypothetical protein
LVGIAVLDPEAATVRKGRPLNLSYLWRVPEPEPWRTLDTLDLRVVEPRLGHGKDHGHNDREKNVIFWVRWSEATDTFELVDPETGHEYGPRFPAGSAHVLKTKDVRLDVRRSTSQGSGPTGQEVTLHLVLILDKHSKRDKAFTVEVTAKDDFGTTQPFLAVGSIAVVP